MQRFSVSVLCSVLVVLSSSSCANREIRAVELGANSQRIAETSSETVLYRFLGRPDGALPGAGFVADAGGALYATTVDGGAHGEGAVYKLTPAGSGYKESILYSFGGGKDGANPVGSLIVDSTGAIYGTTSLGGNQSCVNALGSGCGIVFALTRSGSQYVKRTLYAFNGYPHDGTQPATLVEDASGALYGTTTFGGNSGKCSSEGPGCGTVFELSRSGTVYRESVLHSFNGNGDGLYPADGLLLDTAGKIYGTTSFGGSTDNGAVFRLTPSGKRYSESVIYSFKGHADGFGPNGSLIADATGTLYGTTRNGGTGCGSGCGTVFALRPSGSSYVEKVLYDFQGRFDPAYPTGGLAEKGGMFYGNSGDGGSLHCNLGGCGAVYELLPTGSKYEDRVIYAFKGGEDGQIPLGTLLRDRLGRLYGATGWGGSHNNGTAFYVTP